MFTGKILPEMAPYGLTFGEHCVDLVPYSRKPFIKNKKSGEYFKIRILK
jgi:hypothetical protein